MIKAGVTTREPVKVEVSEEDMTSLARYFATVGDGVRASLEEELRNTTANEYSYRERAEQYEREMAGCQEYASIYRAQVVLMEAKMATLPPPPEPDLVAAKSQLDAVAALPFVESVKILHHGRTDQNVLEVVTRKDLLFTTCDRKISVDGTWYKVKPYVVPLPAYQIHIGLKHYRSYSNLVEALGIKLSDYSHDTSHFVADFRYSQTPHAHWGATNVFAGDFSRLCLGEYESGITQAIRLSLAEGLVEIALYLQQSGDENAYVSKHKWMLWMGKPEYNPLILSKKGNEALETEESAEEDEDENREDAD